MMVLFILLAYTGFVHRYPDAFWSWPFRVLPRGNAIRGQIHHVCGWIMLALLVVHAVGMLGTRAGRTALKDLMPRRSDFRDLWARLLANLGRREAPADHPRFDYVEKSEYWALIWGSAVMALTGIMMIFTEAVLRLLPKYWLDVAQVVHFYEALLATLAILVWHLYAVVFDPSFYPMNTAWLAGKRLPPQPAGEAESPSADSTPDGPDRAAHGLSRHSPEEL
jgi:thiosulfate reductase cytochrome b subunit